MTFPAALSAHLAQDITTVCNCWRLTRKDGMVRGFTDHDVSLTVAGTLCLPNTGLSTSEVRETLGLGIDSIDIEGALSSAEIDEDDVAAGKYDGATVDTFLVNWREPSQYALVRTNTIAKITRSDGAFVAELQSRMSALDQPNGRYFTRNCDADLGDARCRAGLGGSAFSTSGTVTRVVPPHGIAASGLAGYANGWFSLGKLTWNSGANDGVSQQVLTHRISGGEYRLTFAGDRAMDYATGDSFTIVAGCDKSFATCKAKFHNALNFRGFPHLPGNDEVYAYVAEGIEFDGAPLVP